MSGGIFISRLIFFLRLQRETARKKAHGAAPCKLQYGAGQSE